MAVDCYVEKTNIHVTNEPIFPYLVRKNFLLLLVIIKRIPATAHTPPFLKAWPPTPAARLGGSAVIWSPWLGFAATEMEAPVVHCSNHHCVLTPSMYLTNTCSTEGRLCSNQFPFFTLHHLPPAHETGILNDTILTNHHSRPQLNHVFKMQKIILMIRMHFAKQF